MASSMDEVRNVAVNRPKGEDEMSSLTYEMIASKLLNEKYLLTALELHAELCESGREVPILREFFSNPANFESSSVKPEPFTPMPRSSSQVTLDSLDLTRFSEDGGGMDERVAVLEFELRKARENISALRANLTVVTESEGTPDKSSDKSTTNRVPIKPHELRALNYLINEYLLEQSYKLTSITFGDENDSQDFESWEDVGLNIPKPAKLLQVYRDFSKSTGIDKPPSVDASVQTDLDQSQMDELDGKINAITEEYAQFKQQAENLAKENADLLQNMLTNETVQQESVQQEINSTLQNENSNSTTPDKFELVESLSRDISNITQEPEEDDSASAIVSIGETDSGDREWTRIQLPKTDSSHQATLLNSTPRHLPEKFKNEIMSYCIMSTPSSVSELIEQPLKNGITRETLIDILSYSLPRIVPNVILNKREELLPLILSAIRLHSDANEREKLLQLLFNLRKRPQDDERRIILAGIILMLKLEESSVECEEILTVCWEQSQHKYTERRLLAVECCSALAPYTTVHLRNSLILSMLQQMLIDDKEPSVRASVVTSLALLIALMDDPDKYFQCEELALTALQDPSSTVVEATMTVLLPILAQWALELKRLQSHLLSRVISKLRSQLKSTHSPGKEHLDNDRVVSSIKVLQHLLPQTIVCIADNQLVGESVDKSTSSELPQEILKLCSSNLVNPKVFCNNDSVQIGVLINTFVSSSWEGESWQEYEWLTETLVPVVLEMTQSVSINHSNVVNSLLSFVSSLCSGFGRQITLAKILPAFSNLVSKLEDTFTSISTERSTINLTLVPVYLTILATIDGSELAKSLKQFLVAFSTSDTNIASLRISVIHLCAKSSMQEYVFNSLWDGVVHQRASVRCATALLFSTITTHVSERLINTKIAPAIVTLASDSDIIVRASAIPALGKLISDSNSREAGDKARMTLETIARELQDSPSALVVPLVLTLASITSSSSQNYVEDVIATHLGNIAASSLQHGPTTDVGNALIEAYSILVYCHLSSSCVTNVLLPGLRSLETLANQILPGQEETVRTLLREAESRQDAPKSMERSQSMNSGISLSIPSVNVGQGVEDMRQRMSKIFHQKGSAPSISSIFRKK